MNEFCLHLTPSKRLALINSLISEQPIQKELVEWKKDIQTMKMGQLEKIMEDPFKKKLQYILRKRGQKYKLDQQNWTPYTNLENMYDQSSDQMVQAGVA